MKTFDYQGHIIEQRENGYLNLTQMCKASGKEFRDWRRLKSTKAYMEQVSTDVGIPTSVLIEVVKGGDTISSSSVSQGSWGHKLIAVNLARWISPAFAVWCNAHIN